METGDIRGMLDLMVQGAFCVKDNIITHVNQAARARLITEGSSITAHLKTGAEEYRDFSQGCLYLTLDIAGHPCGASVTKLSGADVFVLEQAADHSELQAMALAAQELREPLSNVLVIADQLFPMIDSSTDPDAQKQVAQINRGLFQMLRVIGNMSDAVRYSSETPTRQESLNICALMEDVFTKAQGIIHYGGLQLSYAGPRETIYCSADPEKIERAVYNILSNAMKFTPKGGTIDARFARKGRKLYLTVQDSGPGIPGELRSSVHSRFLRQPGLEDGRFGIGLGMVLIRSTASAHGGTVLIDHPDGCGTRITMTMEIRQPSGTNLRSGILRVDYAGERDHGLIELSDVLPADAYTSEKIN